MNQALRNLKKGQEVWAIVEENIAQGEAIINFGGDLVRVLNLTERPLRPGQRVLLEVEALHPLELKLITRSKKRARFPNAVDITA